MRDEKNNIFKYLVRICLKNSFDDTSFISTTFILIILFKFIILIFNTLDNGVSNFFLFYSPSLTKQGPFTITHVRAYQIDELYIETSDDEWRVSCQTLSDNEFCRGGDKTFHLSSEYSFEIIKEVPHCETCVDEASLVAIYKNNNNIVFKNKLVKIVFILKLFIYIFMFFFFLWLLLQIYYLIKRLVEIVFLG